MRTAAPPAFADIRARCAAAGVALTYGRCPPRAGKGPFGGWYGYRLCGLRPPVALYFASLRAVEVWLWERKHGPMQNLADVIAFRLVHG